MLECTFELYKETVENLNIAVKEKAENERRQLGGLRGKSESQKQSVVCQRLSSSAIWNYRGYILKIKIQ